MGAYVKVWGIGEDGLTESQTDPLVNLAGHQRKIVCVKFHPTANMVLATASADNTVKIWDIENSAEKGSVDHPTLLQDVAWSYNGALLASTCKDKMVRVIDPRTSEVVQQVEAHNGTKTSKITFLGRFGTLCTVGFTRQSKRQFKIWDPRKMAKEIVNSDIDQAAGVIMPFFDEDTNMLYLAGKGDGNIRFYEIVDEAPHQFYLSEFRASNPARGIAMLPKRVVDTQKCEVARMLKLTNKSVEPLSFICPRKSDLFQADLYPDAYAGKSAISASAFFEGKNKNPVTVTMDPSKRPADDTSAPAAPKIQTIASVKAELDQANQRIKELEAKLKAHNISF